MHLGQGVIAIALNTFRETVRDRVLYAFVIFACFLTLAGILLGSLSVNTDARVLEDLGLFTISTIGGIIAIFVGTNLVFKEVDKRTIYLIFTKPISRWEFICGKFLGLALCIFIVILLMGVFLIATVLVTASGGAQSIQAIKPLLESLGLIYLELLLVIAFATFFSTFATPLMSVLFTIGLWLACHVGQSLMVLSTNPRIATSEASRILFQAIYYLLPDLTKLTQLRAGLMDPAFAIPPDVLFVICCYIFAYIVLLLSFATVITERREFQ